MHWIARLFRRVSLAQQLQDVANEVAAKRRLETADVVRRIDDALQSGSLLSDEPEQLGRAKGQIIAGECSMVPPWEHLRKGVRALWHPQVREEHAYADIVRGETPKPNLREWSLALTDEFVKSTGGLDRKLQGRILEALHHIASAPTSPRGDTVKALTGNLAGLWRFRIGDFRLSYKPDGPSKRIYLLSFGGRGAIYH